MDATSGVTRDRHYGKTDWNGKEFSLIDTGGYVIGGGDTFEAANTAAQKTALAEPSSRLKAFAKKPLLTQPYASVSVNVNIEEKKDVYIHNTFFEKTGNIDSTIVLRELTYEKGDLYTKKETDKTLKQLREMGIFSMANLTPVRVANSDSLVNLVIEFRRYKQREWY